MTPALVLTAGRGTRLRPLSLVRAKAAVPVAGTPLIGRILRWLAVEGVEDAVLNLHHCPDTITSVVGDGAETGVRVRYSWEPVLLGSAGGPRHALPLLVEPRTPNVEPGTRNPEPAGFLIVNGDTLTEMELSAILTDHRESGALATLAVVPNTEPEKYGGVLVAGDGSVTGFVGRGSTTTSFHFIGVQVANAEAFDTVSPSTPYESFGALYPNLIATRRGSVRAFQTAAECLDLGTTADYLATALLLASREGTSLAPGARARIAVEAVLERSILWDDVSIDEGAVLRECVVTDGARVPAGTSWHRQTIRRYDGVLAPAESRVGDLAVASF